MTELPARKSSWAELFAPAHRGTAVVLAGGVAVYATNTYVTTSLLPSAIEDIGGEQFYSWAMTVFMIASVITSMLVRRVIDRYAPFGAYAIALATFAAGSLVSTLAPDMAVLLIGRALQGLGGGLLTGLGFSVVRIALPEHLWSRAIGLVSAMWGVGNILGPILGGLLAELGLWRWAFGIMVVASLALILLARTSLPPREKVKAAGGVPYAPLMSLTLAVLALSTSSITTGVLTYVLVGVAVLGGLAFVLTDRRSREGVLPGLTYSRGSQLKWVYVAVALLVIGSTSETFIPWFGQELGGMSPLVAGLLGAALSWGWSVGGILSSSVDVPARRAFLRVLGPVVLGVALIAYGLLQVVAPPVTVVVLWFVVLFIAGLGIGMAMVHNITAAMASTDDPEQAMQASAGTNTVQLISNAVGAALGGLIVNAAGSSVDGAARWLALSLGVLALAGALVAAFTTRARRR